MSLYIFKKVGLVQERHGRGMRSTYPRLGMKMLTCSLRKFMSLVTRSASLITSALGGSGVERAKHEGL